MSGTLTVTTAIQIPKSRIADLLCCAFEGGISRGWCRIYNHRKPRKPQAFVSTDGKLYPHCDYPLAPGGAVMVYETDNLTDEDVRRDKSKLLRLDLAAVNRGLALMPTLAPRHFGAFMAGNEDAETGDVFLQLCTLGELRYG
jgi:hypothetical protein